MVASVSERYYTLAAVLIEASVRRKEDFIMRCGVI